MHSNENIIDFLSEHITDNPKVLFNGKEAEFSLNSSQSDVEKILDNNLDFSIFQNKCKVDITKALPGGVNLFFDEGDFLRRFPQKQIEFISSEIVVLNYDKKLAIKKTNEDFSQSKGLIFNFYYYHQIFDFLVRDPKFVTILKDSDLQFIIFTTDKGPFHIGYDPHESRVKDLENLKLVFELLQTQFAKVDFVQFFKSAIIQTIHEYNINDRFFHLVSSLRVILNVAERDHDIYIRQFDFDKIKSKFKEEKNTYFEGIDKNIESVNKQVFSVPLTFAASTYAAFQVKEKPLILILIIFGYLLYTWIAYKALDISRFNINEIENDVKKEEAELRKGYQILFSEFEGDFRRIYAKLSKINTVIDLIEFVLFALLFSFAFFFVMEYQAGH
jgi:hypothetical protein